METILRASQYLVSDKSGEREEKIIKRGEEEEGIPAPSDAIVVPKKSKKSKSKSTKNKKDTNTIASISKQLERQTAAIDKIEHVLQSLRKAVKSVERQSELIKQVQSQIKQLEKQISQVGKTIQKR